MYTYKVGFKCAIDPACIGLQKGFTNARPLNDIEAFEIATKRVYAGRVGESTRLLVDCARSYDNNCPNFMYRYIPLALIYIYT